MGEEPKVKFITQNDAGRGFRQLVRLVKERLPGKCVPRRSEQNSRQSPPPSDLDSPP